MLDGFHIVKLMPQLLGPDLISLFHINIRRGHNIRITYKIYHEVTYLCTWSRLLQALLSLQKLRFGDLDLRLLSQPEDLLRFISEFITDLLRTTFKNIIHNTIAFL